MRKIILIILAVTIVFGASVILYKLGAWLGSLLPGFPPDVFLKFLSGAPLMGTKNVYEFLEASSAKRAFGKTGLSATVSVEEFSIHPLSAFLLCLITWSGVFFFTGGLMGVLVGISESEIDTTKPKAFASLVGVTAFPLRVIAAAYLGCWIGTRSRRYVFGIVIGCIALGSIADHFLSKNLMPSDEYRAIFNDIPPFDTLVEIVLYMIPGALGFWYGQRQKPAYYLAFIMRMLPQEISRTIVEMAQDEAVRARPPAMQASS